VAIDAETLGAGGPVSPARPLSVTRARTARRIAVDRWASRGVVLGGVTIIGSILAILVVIVAEMGPLFRAPTVSAIDVRSRLPSGAAPVGPLGVDEYREVAYQVTADGRVEFLPLEPKAAFDAVRIPGLDRARVTTVASLGGGRYLVGTSDGRGIPLEMKFDVGFPEGRRVITPAPVFAPPVRIDPARHAVQRVAAAWVAEAPIIVAQEGPTELIVHWVVETKSLVDAGSRTEGRRSLAVDAAGGITALALDQRGENLFVGTSRGQLVRYDLRDVEAPRRMETVEVASTRGGAVSALGFLIGDRTLVVGDAGGGVSTWQVVAPAIGGAVRLTRIHRFRPHEQAVTAISGSRRDKGFVTADASGLIRLHYGTTGRTLLTLRSKHSRLASVVIAPKADGVLALSDNGTVSHWGIRNPHPEVTIGTLFGRVWYEGYAQPEYVWQSTGGTDDFEAKFSLAPLIFGTFKGTLYALLFAVPLALLAALYVSEFMHASLKAYVKPVVEIMAALPSVVLGFLAGLWLAPLVERIVPGLFMLPIVLPLCILGSLVLWRALPRSFRGRFRAGVELAWLVPVVACGIWIAFLLGGLVEARLLGGDYRGWLLSAVGLTYDQRNALVVGIAMGFAVIPIIFTIAEDSLSNVPAHLRAGSLALGATHWQTAVRVVLPTASPGIFSAIMIGFGRAVGETMIVLMATGNTPVMEWSVFNGLRALSANIAVELPEAPEGGTLFRVLFLAAFLLFCLTFIVNTVAELVRLKLRQRYRYL
jgi:phosphate transport system permease protein